MYGRLRTEWWRSLAQSPFAFRVIHSRKTLAASSMSVSRKRGRTVIVTGRICRWFPRGWCIPSDDRLEIATALRGAYRVFVIDLTYLKFESGCWIRESYPRLKGRFSRGFRRYPRKSRGLASPFITMINVLYRKIWRALAKDLRGIWKGEGDLYKLWTRYALMSPRLILNESYLRLKAKFAKLSRVLLN